MLSSKGFVMSELFLGFDLSTQSLTVAAINHLGEQKYFKSLNFDEICPQYHTKNGSIEKDGTITAPAIMWVEAFFKLLNEMKNDNFPFCQVTGISSDAQQHGSVFWKTKDFAKELFNNDWEEENLLVIAENIFSVSNSPIWRDSSTKYECEYFLSKQPEVWWKQTTGSIPYERFTGTQLNLILQVQNLRY